MENVKKGMFYMCEGYILSLIISILLGILNLTGNGESIGKLLENNLIPMTIYVLFIAPILEEMIFRYLMYSLILRRVMKLQFWYAAGITSIIFGIMHYPIVTIIITTALSLLLCYICDKEQTVIYCMFFHFGFNLYSYSGGDILLTVLVTLIFINSQIKPLKKTENK